MLVAVGTGTAEVPTIVKLTSGQADQALRAKGLTLGQRLAAAGRPGGEDRQPDPGRRPGGQAGHSGELLLREARAAGQGPGQGERRRGRSGEEVRRAGRQGRRGARDRGRDRRRGGRGRARCQRTGSCRSPSTRSAPRRRGPLIKTVPAAGTKLKAGDKLTLVVSAGFPQLVFDNGHDIIDVNGATGKKLNSPAHGPQDEVDPTWSPDATSVIYSSGGQLFLRDLTKKNATAKQLTSQATSFTNPAWAPTAETRT